MGSEMPSKCCGNTNKSVETEVDTELENDFISVICETDGMGCSIGITQGLQQIEELRRALKEMKDESTDKYTQLKQQLDIEKNEKTKLIQQIQVKNSIIIAFCMSQNQMIQNIETTNRNIKITKYIKSTVGRI